MNADAAGMRHAAAQLQSRAERIGGVINRLDAQVAAMTYAGPAADRFHASIAEHRAVLANTQGILRGAADTLVQGAANAEAQTWGATS